jgi:hypothetical protein
LKGDLAELYAVSFVAIGHGFRGLVHRHHHVADLAGLRR